MAEEIKRALVVEDNADNFQLIKYALRRGGYEVLWAQTGEEGVDMARTDQPDLIVMDINMPGIDGLEATRRIRKFDKDNTIPIVAITSYAMLGDREKVLEAGCDGYLEKPINPLTVVASIEEIVEQSGKRSDK